MKPWQKALLIRAGAAAALVLASAWAVRAASEGETRQSLSFAGTLLTEAGAAVAGPVELSFTFKSGATLLCAPTLTGVEPSKTGAFQVEIPISSCPKRLFDGSDVTLSVSANGAAVAIDQPIAAIPHAKYAQQRGSPDCPLGYAVSDALRAPKLCRRGVDNIVKVGDGAAAFWIDRFEASIWSAPDGGGTRYGENASDYPATFPPTGQYTVPLYAVSRSGVAPSRWVSWFQANEACRASGKRLPKPDEWWRAARRTVDPGSSTGTGGACLTEANSPRLTGNGAGCRSAVGAEDMIGNLAEWVLDWQVTVGNSRDVNPINAWPSNYGGDGVWNIASRAASTESGELGNLPAALALGGSFSEGAGAGLFSIDYRGSPARLSNSVGFRCMVPR
jgi:hypothetical protein